MCKENIASYSVHYWYNSPQESITTVGAGKGRIFDRPVYGPLVMPSCLECFFWVISSCLGHLYFPSVSHQKWSKIQIRVKSQDTLCLPQGPAELWSGLYPCPWPDTEFTNICDSWHLFPDSTVPWPLLATSGQHLCSPSSGHIGILWFFSMPSERR